MTLKVAIVVGNPKPKSRTLRVAELLVQKFLAGRPCQVTVIDLADHAAEIFQWPSDHMARLNGQVAESDLVVIASPTYKATYTGLLKAFLDRYPANGLHGAVAIPVMTGADLGHSMAPVVTLGPVLVELGASVPFKGFYLAMNQMDHLDELVAAAVADWSKTSETLRKLVSPAADATRISQFAGNA